MNLYDLNVRIDRAGRLPTRINAGLVELISAGVLTEAQAGVVLGPLRELSDALASIQQWSDGQVPAAQARAAAPALSPGMKVVDVGSADEGRYTGPLDPDTLLPGAWRYWGEHNELHARTGQIFSKQPVLLDPATGKLLTMGDYAHADPDGAPFAGL